MKPIGATLSAVALGAWLLAGAPATARATPNFPPAIERILRAEREPRCTVCHATTSGGRGTATRPFAIQMIGYGLVAYDEVSLATALERARVAASDIDGDGVTDIAALTAGNNPNGAAFDPQFGCGRVSRAPTARGGEVAIALVALVVAGACARRDPAGRSSTRR